MSNTCKPHRVHKPRRTVLKQPRARAEGVRDLERSIVRAGGRSRGVRGHLRAGIKPDLPVSNRARTPGSFGHRLQGLDEVAEQAGLRLGVSVCAPSHGDRHRDASEAHFFARRVV